MSDASASSLSPRGERAGVRGQSESDGTAAGDSTQRLVTTPENAALSVARPPHPVPLPARGEGTRIRAGYRSAKRLTRHHAKSFFFASFALFGARRDAAFALYAFCRRLDDLVDEGSPEGMSERLAAARDVTTSVFRGAPDAVAARAAKAFDAAELDALADAVERFSIPQQPMLDLLSGMEMDLTPRRYASWAELEHYCYCVAGTVGLLMTPVLGFRSTAALGPAADLGRAMQLTNILRDVREDLGRGRCYLPQDELKQFSLTEDDLRAGTVDDRFTAFMIFQSERARALYRKADAGIPHLEGFGSQPMVRLMGTLYEEILSAIEAQAFDVFRARAHVPMRRKLVLAARVLFSGARA